MKKTGVIIVIIANAFLLQAQQTSSSADSLRKDALNVYMDANDYIRKEIPFVNYVRDLKDADVYVISTSQRTGSGGTEYTYFLNGQNDYIGMKDTVSYVSSPDETSEERRIKQVNILKMAFIKFL